MENMSNILNILKQIGCTNAKSDGICNISVLRDECWVKMFAEQGYDKGELIFPDGGHSSFFLVLPDGNIASADNVMCANGFYAVAEELGFDADEVLGTEPYGQFFMYEDEDGLEYEDCSISIWTPQEFLMKMKQCKQLANTNETIQEAYDLDAEMAVWEERANSKFGQLLKQLDDVTREEMGCELDEYGFEQSIISHYITAYSLDGDKSYTLKIIKHILGEYDLLQNKRIRNLLSQLEMSLNESKNMNTKNTIRLTESELKNVIIESAKNIISELDWKTYANAAKKSKYDNPKRATKFAQKATDAFNDKFSKGNVSGHVGIHGPHGTYSSYAPFGEEELGLEVQGYSNDGVDSYMPNEKRHKGIEAYINKTEPTYKSGDIDIPSQPVYRDKSYKYGFKQRMLGYNGSNKNFDSLSKDDQKHFRDAEQEFQHYRNGEYDYSKGRGWHLPESIISKAINESLKNIIKEMQPNVGYMK